jgi:hypothetical protein
MLRRSMPAGALWCVVGNVSELGNVVPLLVAKLAVLLARNMFGPGNEFPVIERNIVFE